MRLTSGEGAIPVTARQRVLCQGGVVTLMAGCPYLRWGIAVTEHKTLRVRLFLRTDGINNEVQRQ